MRRHWNQWPRQPDTHLESIALPSRWSTRCPPSSDHERMLWGERGRRKNGRHFSDLEESRMIRKCVLPAARHGEHRIRWTLRTCSEADTTLRTFSGADTTLRAFSEPEPPSVSTMVARATLRSQPRKTVLLRNLRVETTPRRRPPLCGVPLHKTSNKGGTARRLRHRHDGEVVVPVERREEEESQVDQE